MCCMLFQADTKAILYSMYALTPEHSVTVLFIGRKHLLKCDTHMYCVCGLSCVYPVTWLWPWLTLSHFNGRASVFLFSFYQNQFYCITLYLFRCCATFKQVNDEWLCLFPFLWASHLILCLCSSQSCQCCLFRLFRKPWRYDLSSVSHCDFHNLIDERSWRKRWTFYHKLIYFVKMI